jgi:GT2 family glycosyltransferase
MISYVLPTRNRPDVLERTLRALGALPCHDAEVIVVDNASDLPPHAPVVLNNGLPVHLHFRTNNEGAAARNHGVRESDPSSRWIVMLDDDSHPLDLRFLEALGEQPGDVAAVSAEIFLPSPRGREAGGLPEVFTGCGVAVRRDAFLEAGGYDPSFNYYVEEYDLSAKLLLAGHRVVLDRRFRVLHEKAAGGRDMHAILRRLVRNNAWVAQRYAPAEARRDELHEVFARYASIAAKEKAMAGYTAGAAEALATLHTQVRTPMSRDIFDRFTGLAEARRSLQEAYDERPFRSAAIVDAGKNARLVRRALDELGVHLVDEPDAEAVVIATLSPGPVLDAWERRVAADTTVRVISPWSDLTTRAPRAALSSA